MVHPTINPERLVFIGGLHRSGTTALGRILADHPEMSGIHDTDVEEDEGQHLQHSYAPAIAHGGPGRFARSDAAHLTAASADPETTRQDLLEAWAPHWDLDRRLLVEKSPPNMIMGRYLQDVFPGSGLIVILRHPIVVALSTKKWAKRQTLERLVEHWFIAHDLLRADSVELSRLHVLHYEHLINDPRPTLDGISKFVGVRTPFAADRIEARRSDSYLATWRAMADGSPLARSAHRRIVRRFAERAAGYGYDIDRPDLAPASALSMP